MKHFITSIRITVILLLIVSGLYPLIVWGIAQAAFKHQANGSLIADASGKVIGSELLAQGFTKPEYFHPRPSAAGNGYDPTMSGGANLGPTSRKLIDNIRDLAVAYRTENGLPADTKVPVDAVTRSASGLDPHVTPENAALQVPRVAKARGMTEGAVRAIVARHTEGRDLGFLGEPRVNVLTLNIALDKANVNGH
jgi:K+-transporting ATPase ATPase C chain